MSHHRLEETHSCLHLGLECKDKKDTNKEPCTLVGTEQEVYSVWDNSEYLGPLHQIFACEFLGLQCYLVALLNCSCP